MLVFLQKLAQAFKRLQIESHMMRSMFNGLKIYFLAFGLSMAASCAMSKDIVVQRAIYEDIRGEMQLEQIKAANFMPAHEVIFKGFSRSKFWVRLEVDVPDNQRTLSIQLRPNVLDEASIFYKDAEQSHLEVMLKINSRHQQKETQISLAPGKQYIYLRLSSQGAILTSIQVLSLDAANEKAFNDQLKFGGVLAIYGALFVILLLVLTEHPSQLILLFLMHLFVCFSFYILFFDLNYDLIPNEWAQNKSLARLSTIVTFLSFTVLLQAVFGQVDKPQFQRIARFAAAIAICLVILFLSGEQFLALKLTSIFATLTTMALIGMLTWVLVQFLQNNEFKLKIRILFGLIAFLFFGIVIMAMLQLLGILTPTAFLLESPNLRAIFMPLTLIGLIWQHELNHKKMVEKTNTEKMIQEIQEKELQLRLGTQSQFTAMLMHELKTPLYIIQIAASSLGRNVAGNHPDSKRLNNIDRALDDINFILDRCVQADQLDQNDLPIQKTTVSLKSLLAEVNHLNEKNRIAYSGISDAKIFSDYQYARIVIINLVTNALKYSPSDSSVLVHVEDSGLMSRKKLKFRVSNLVGSAGQPNPQKIFTKYYREEAAKTGAGAGLGLWLANSIATKLGAKLECISEGEWVHFEFFLEQA